MKKRIAKKIIKEQRKKQLIKAIFVYSKNTPSRFDTSIKHLICNKCFFNPCAFTNVVIYGPCDYADYKFLISKGFTHLESAARIVRDRIRISRQIKVYSKI